MGMIRVPTGNFPVGPGSGEKGHVSCARRAGTENPKQKSKKSIVDRN